MELGRRFYPGLASPKCLQPESGCITSPKPYLRDCPFRLTDPEIRNPKFRTDAPAETARFLFPVHCGHPGARRGQGGFLDLLSAAEKPQRGPYISRAETRGTGEAFLTLG